jgi:GT2 family glycosyltransferase
VTVQLGTTALPVGELVTDMEARYEGQAGLVAPAAVRLIDLDAPVENLHLPPARDGRPYRSLLAVARLEGDPVGAATFAVGPPGRVPRQVLEFGLRRTLIERGVRPGVLAGPWSPPNTPVTVVVTTCCDPLPLERCLRSLLACNYEDLEVIVVENRPGSAATRRMLATRLGASPDLRYVEEPRPGLSRARNAGLVVATGELVGFVDDDTILDPDWIERFVRRFEWSPDVACVTGLILPLELETESQLLLEQFAGFGKGFDPRTYRLRVPDNGAPVYPYAPGAIGSGANTILRRSVALDLGGFEPTLGTGTPAMGGEDLDLYMRLLLRGQAIAYEPSAIVWHEHPDGPGRLRSHVYRYGVGLGATFAKRLFQGPARRELIRAVPTGLRYANDPQSRKNAAKGDGYPRRLDWIERAGIMAGPVAYALSAIRERLGQRSTPAPEARPPFRQLVRLPNGNSVGVASFPDGEPRGAGALWSRNATPEQLLTTVAIAACVIAPLAVALGLPSGVRLAAVLTLFCLAPGAALVTALRGRPEPGLVIAASLACSVLVAQSMLWLGAWWPQASLYFLAAFCLAVLVAGSHIRPRRTVRGSPAAAWSETWRVPPHIAWHIALIGVAMTAWAASLLGADMSRIAGLGLLNAVPPTYFLAFALLLAGFVAAVSRSVLTPWLLGLYVLALIVVLHGTTPFLYEEPRYPWTYTHLGVINSIAETGAVDRRVDIYSNWPGFLALNAWFSRLIGLPPAAYAEWAQVFFNLANVAAVRFALRGVTANERLVWTATWLFLLGNWIGQDYLAPQAFAFVLAVVIVGLALRAELPVIVPRSRAGHWLSGLIGRLRRVLPHGRRVLEPHRPSPLSPRGAVLVGGICYLAVLVSHQLTPVVLLTGMAALALIARRVPLWVPVAMAFVELVWVALAWSYVNEHYSVFDPDPASSAAPAGYQLGSGLPGLALVAQAARLELVLVGGLALIGLVRRLRARRWDLAVASLVVAPVLIVGFNSYGGEGRYRFYLFALPWLCCFAAVACAPAASSRIRGVFRGWRLALATAALGVCMLLAYFGLELSSHITSQDVHTAAWFERHAPRDALVMGLAPNFPRRMSARYTRVYDPAFPGVPALSDYVAYRRRRLDRGDVPRIAATLGAFGARHTFLILTPSQERFGRLYGLLPPGTSESLTRALRASRLFRPVYERGPAAIFELRPRAERSRR